MQKFIAIVVLAFATAAYAHPTGLEGEQMSFAAPQASEPAEFANLGELKKYTDFCSSSRDYVLTSIKELTNNQASAVFNLIFKNVEDVATKALEAQNSNARTITDQIAHPENEVPEDVDGPIGEGLNKIHNGQVQPKSFFDGFVSVVTATKDNVKESLTQKFQELTQLADISLLSTAAKMTCGLVEDFNKSLREQFDHFNRQTGYDSKYMDVKCLTTQRIDMFHRVCNLVQVASQPLMNIYRRSDDE